MSSLLKFQHTLIANEFLTVSKRQKVVQIQEHGCIQEHMGNRNIVHFPSYSEGNGIQGEAKSNLYKSKYNFMTINAFLRPVDHVKLPSLSPKVNKSDKVKTTLQGSNCSHSRVVTTKKSIFQFYPITFFSIFTFTLTSMHSCLCYILNAAESYCFSWFLLSLLLQKIMCHCSPWEFS